MTKSVLFILMRNDMQSMNAGKACAQAAHAANAVKHHFLTIIKDDTLIEEFSFWETQTAQGFGTTIVLGVNETQMKETIDALKDDYVCGIVHDPTYPVKDGDVMHLIPVDTCAYIFAFNKDDKYLKLFLNKFNLY
jgi:peptidyl-tRNA hydrolase